jgi:vancomycin resistance protein YoaR
MPQSAIDRLADNAWLKAIERIAIPFIGLVLWSQWNTIEELKRNAPTIELRLSQIESVERTAASTAAATSVDRMKFQQDISTELATLSTQMANLKETTFELKTEIRELSAMLERQKSGKLILPEKPL